MKRLFVGLLVAFLGVAAPEDARAYTIASGFTKSCHERMTIPALTHYLARLEPTEVPLPQRDLWKGATGDIQSLVEGDATLDGLLAEESLRFAAVSLLIGLREPDTDGHAVTDLNAIRSVHGDPTPRSQYAHTLRSKEDEGSTGDLHALVGTRDYVEEELRTAALLMNLPGPAQIVETFLYVEHYGRIEVEVWGPAYRLGLALHTLQDSFAHTIRSPNGYHILHVLNFINAYDGTLESGDGLAHSSGMDQCDEEENALLVQLAEGRSMAMVSALLKAGDGDAAAVAAGVSDCAEDEVGDPECGWFAYEPTCQERAQSGESLDGTCCSEDTDFCDAQHLQTILDTPTKPVLKEAFGCAVSPSLSERPLRGGAPAAMLAFISILSLWRRRARRKPPVAHSVHRAARGRVTCASLLLLSVWMVFPQPTLAQEHHPATAVLRIEAHGSVLTDAARESILNISYGPGLRGGYRWAGTDRGQFGLYGLVERDSWFVSEFENRVDPGVVNLGLGVEWLYYYCLRSALSFGPSILVFDTGLHDSGNVGIYAELYPLGLQLNLARRWALAVDPLSVAWVNPTPEYGQAPSVGHIQYRTTIALEWRAVPTRPSDR